MDPSSLASVMTRGLAGGEGAARPWVILEAEHSGECLSWLLCLILAVTMDSSRAHARRGSAGCESKASTGG